MDQIQKFESSVKEVDRDAATSKWQGKRKTFKQMLDAYKVQKEVAFKLDFRPWLVNFANIMSPLEPGEMLGILANTGGGKTAVIQQIITKLCAPLKTLLLEMELPDSSLMKRFIAMKMLRHTDSAEQIAREGKADHLISDFEHLVTYSHVRLDIKEIEEIIDFEKPQVVIVDYVGLIRATGKTRYEKMSDIVEELKIFANTKNVAMIVSTQVRRDPNRESPEIFLHDAKDSGSIENSAQKAIGVWREGEKGEIMKIKILKNQGLRDIIFTYNFNNENLNIWNG